MKNYFRKSLLPCLTIASVLFFFSNCAEKIVNTQGEPQKVTISLKTTSLAGAADIDYTLLTITGPGIETPIVDTLVLTDSSLTGEVTVPSGLNRTFLLEAMTIIRENVANTIPIYRGETTVDIAPNVPTIVSISLYPVAPLIKLSPRYREVQLPWDSTFIMDIKAYNIDSVREFNFTLDDNNYGDYCRTDSIVASSALGGNLLYTYNGSHSIDFTISREGSAVVDQQGNGTLARIYLHCDTVYSLTTQTYSILAYPIVKLNGDTIGTNIYYTDGATILMHPDTTAPVAPLIRLSPRYREIQLPQDSTFTMDLKVYNLDSVREFNFTLYDNYGYYCQVDSIVASSALGGNPLYSSDYHSTYIDFTISKEGSAVVDQEGNGTLARIYLYCDGVYSDATQIYSIWAGPVVKLNGDTIRTNIYTDGATILIHPDPNQGWKRGVYGAKSDSGMVTFGIIRPK
ncbi:MAG: hypothetical protein NTV06_06165 [candidate division Zixibacteria bacterium]|nr:hypothetical protein [candidate division Zixibacteria bacterium]